MSLGHCVCAFANVAVNLDGRAIELRQDVLGCGWRVGEYPGNEFGVPRTSVPLPAFLVAAEAEQLGRLLRVFPGRLQDCLQIGLMMHYLLIR